MNQIDLDAVEKFICDTIDESFFDRKIAKLRAFRLSDVVKRKNPYLFKSKGIETASDYIRDVMDATVSSGEETVFGSFLEQLAIHICAMVYNGHKSTARGIDLEFTDNNVRYLVSIKSGPNWANSSQRVKMIRDFTDARKILATSGGSKHLQVQCIEGCCYGIDNRPDKGNYKRLCGQQFWELISGGESRLYLDLIEPLGRSAADKAAQLKLEFAHKLNSLTAEFVQNYCDDGAIDWEKLVRANSGF